MADDSLEITNPLDFDPCDLPHGMKDFVLDDLTDEQKIKLCDLKRRKIREDQEYLSTHPEVRGIIALITRLLLNRRPRTNIYHCVAEFFTKPSADIQEEVNNYLQERDLILAAPSSTSLYAKFLKQSISGDILDYLKHLEDAEEEEFEPSDKWKKQGAEKEEPVEDYCRGILDTVLNKCFDEIGDLRKMKSVPGIVLEPDLISETISSSLQSTPEVPAADGSKYQTAEDDSLMDADKRSSLAMAPLALMLDSDLSVLTKKALKVPETTGDDFDRGSMQVEVGGLATLPEGVRRPAMNASEEYEDQLASFEGEPPKGDNFENLDEFGTPVETPSAVPETSEPQDVVPEEAPLPVESAEEAVVPEAAIFEEKLPEIQDPAEPQQDLPEYREVVEENQQESTDTQKPADIQQDLPEGNQQESTDTEKPADIQQHLPEYKEVVEENQQESTDTQKPAEIQQDLPEGNQQESTDTEKPAEIQQDLPEHKEVIEENQQESTDTEKPAEIQQETQQNPPEDQNTPEIKQDPQETENPQPQDTVNTEAPAEEKLPDNVEQ